MKPSNTWFPQSLQERAAWFENFNNQMQTIGASLGFSAGELTALGTDQQFVAFLGDTIPALDAYSGAIRQFKEEWTEGDIGDPTLVFPATVAFTPPGPVPPTGCFERLDKMVKRIRTAPNYTEEIGALLGIIPSKPEEIGEAELKPVLKASAMPGNVVEVRFTRGDTNGILVEMQLDNDPAWTSGGQLNSSPASLNIPDGTGLPRSVKLRARYVIKNSPVGLNSDIVTVVTTP